MNPTTQDRLVGLIVGGNATAWTAFITGHESMVHDLAHTLRMTDQQYEELVGEGHVALCESAREFVRGNYGCRFTTYAYYRVRRAMVSFQRTEVGMSAEWTARVAVKTRKDMEHLRALFRAMDINREPTPDDLAYVSLMEEPDEHDVRRFATRLNGTPKLVPLEHAEAISDEPGCCDSQFAESLSGPTREVWCGMLKQITITGNASLSLEAQRLKRPRAEVRDRLVCALKEWARTHAD